MTTWSMQNYSGPTMENQIHTGMDQSSQISINWYKSYCTGPQWINQDHTRTIETIGDHTNSSRSNQD